MFISLAQCLLEWYCLSVLILLLLYFPLSRIPTSIYQIRISAFSFLRVSPCPGFTIAANGSSTELDAQVQIQESPYTSLSSSLPHSHHFIKSCWHFHHNTPQIWRLLAIFMVPQYFKLSPSLTWTTANSPILTTSFSWAPIIYSPKVISCHCLLKTQMALPFSWNKAPHLGIVGPPCSGPRPALWALLPPFLPFLSATPMLHTPQTNPTLGPFSRRQGLCMAGSSLPAKFQLNFHLLREASLDHPPQSHSLPLRDSLPALVTIWIFFFSSMEVYLTNKILRYLKCTTWWFDIEMHCGKDLPPPI